MNHKNKPLIKRSFRCYASPGVFRYLSIPVKSGILPCENASERSPGDIFLILPGEDARTWDYGEATVAHVFNPAEDFESLYPRMRSGSGICLARREFLPMLRGKGIRAFPLPENSDELPDYVAEVLARRPERDIYATPGVFWYLSLPDDGWIMPASKHASANPGDIVLALPDEDCVQELSAGIKCVFIVNPIKDMINQCRRVRKRAAFFMASEETLPLLRMHGSTAVRIPDNPAKAPFFALDLLQKGLNPVDLDNMPKPPLPRLSLLMAMDAIQDGGMANVFLPLCSFLKKFGDSVLVGYRDSISPAAEKWLAARGIPFSRIPRDATGQREFCESNHIDLINSHYTLELAEVASALGTPYIQTVHNMYVWNEGSDLDFWRYKYSLMDAFLCVSDACADVIATRYWVPQEKLTVVRNGIDCQIGAAISKSAARSALGLPVNGFAFINVAALIPLKKQDVLIKAFAEAFPDDENVFLIFVGDACDRGFLKRLEELVAARRLENRVVFAGFQANVPQWLAAADSFVLPSALEGWSLALDEARMAGLPLIATRTGGAVDQLDGPDDILLPSYFPDTEPDYARLSFAEVAENPEADERICRALADAMRRQRLNARNMPPKPRPAPNDSGDVFRRHRNYMYRVWKQKLRRRNALVMSR